MSFIPVCFSDYDDGNDDIAIICKTLVHILTPLKALKCAFTLFIFKYLKGNDGKN